MSGPARSSSDEHGGCRVCGRTDVTLKADETLRHHVHTFAKGSSFLRAQGGRCGGSGHPPKGVVGRYARRVVANLRDHFPDLNDPVVAEVIGEAVQKHHAVPDETFEALLDSAGNWRLRPNSQIPGRVLVACYRFKESDADRTKVERLNTALAEISFR